MIDHNPPNDTSAPVDNTSTSAAPEPRTEAARQLSQLIAMGRYYHRLQRHGRNPWSDPQRGQGRVLAILKLKPEISQRELSYLLDMSKQAVAELLAKLENRGLITRRPSPDDRRVMQIRLTDAGKAASLGPRRGDIITQELLADFTDQDAAQLSQYLDHLLMQIEERIEQVEPEDRRQRREDLQRMPAELREFGDEFAGFRPRGPHAYGRDERRRGGSGYRGRGCEEHHHHNCNDHHNGCEEHHHRGRRAGRWNDCC